MTKKYTLTPEHRAQLKPWADQWIANAMSTKAMDDADRAAMRVAIKGLYEAAGKTPPPEHRIVFVPSPLVGNVAAGFAAGIWWLRKNRAATRAATDAATNDATNDATDAATRAATDVATYAATYAATDAATRAATNDATYVATRVATDVATYDATDAATRAATNDATNVATNDATYAATYAATNDATNVATNDATYAATYAATRAATDVATYAATYVATRVATDVATYAATYAATDDATYAATNHGWAFRLSVKFGNAEFMAGCAQKAWSLRNGGNHWSGWCAYLSFFRHVAKLPIDYSKWQHYEAAARHGSWRWMHEDFCIVSDRPAVIKIDAQRRPHCEDGPSHEWRDGWKLYHWKGVRIPPELIEQRHTMTPAHIMAIDNAEHRRCAIEIYAHVHGPSRFVADLGAKALTSDLVQGRPRTLYGLGDARFLHVVNGSLEPDGTRREFILGAPAEARTPADAVAWSYGRPAKKYQEAVRT